MAAEFLIELKPNINEQPFPVISLALDTSTITACGNDIGFDNIFSRNLEALGKKEDLLLVISTSGNSKNILSNQKSKNKKIDSIAFLGSGGEKAKNLCDFEIIVSEAEIRQIKNVTFF